MGRLEKREFVSLVSRSEMTHGDSRHESSKKGLPKKHILSGTCAYSVIVLENAYLIKLGNQSQIKKSVAVEKEKGKETVPLHVPRGRLIYEDLGTCETFDIYLPCFSNPARLLQFSRIRI